MPLLCLIIDNCEIYQSESEVHKPDTMYQSVLYYAEFTLFNKLLERLKIFATTPGKHFQLALNEFLFGAPCYILVILQTLCSFSRKF